MHNPEKQVTFDYYSDPYSSFFFPSKGPTNGGTAVDVQGFGFKMERPHIHDQLWARFVDPSSKTELAPATQVEQEHLGVDAFRWKTPSIKNA